MKQSILSAAILTLGLVAGCGTTSETGGDESYKQILQQAKSTHKQGVEISNAWSITEETIEKAEAAAKAGDNEQATKLSQKALKLAELALAQAEKEKNAEVKYPD